MNQSVQIWRGAVAGMARGMGVLLMLPVVYFWYMLYLSLRITLITYLLDGYGFKTGMGYETNQLHTNFDNVGQFAFDLFRFKVVMLFWNFTGAFGFWTLPQLIAVASLIRATSKHVTIDLETTLMSIWKKTQVLFLVLETTLLIFLEFYHYKRAESKNTQEDLMSALIIKLDFVSQLVFVCLCFRTFFFCVVLHYEKIKTAELREQPEPGNKV